jgi:hypothetical protein
MIVFILIIGCYLYGYFFLAKRDSFLISDIVQCYKNRDYDFTEEEMRALDDTSCPVAKKYKKELGEF